MRSINQARHFYVVNNASDVVTVAKDNTLVFKIKNAKGEIVPSDVIKIDNIISAVKTTASTKNLLPKLKTVTATAASIIKGNEYVVKVVIKNIAGEDNTVVRYGSAVAASGTVSVDFYDALRDSLNKVLDGMAVATSSANGLVITAGTTEDTHEIGVNPFKVFDFDVTLIAEEEGAWNPVAVSYTDYDGVNGPIIADMEWFYIGARGDMYRNFSHPYGPKTKVSAIDTNDYDVLDIHYAYVGPNEGVQKSEKTITIAAVPAAFTTATTGIDAVLSGKVTVTSAPKQEADGKKAS